MKKLIKLLVLAPFSLFTILTFCSSCGRVPPVVVEEGVIVAQTKLWPKIRNLTYSSSAVKPSFCRAADFASRRYTNPSGVLNLDVQPNSVIFVSPTGTSYRQTIGSPSIKAKNLVFTNEELASKKIQHAFNKHEIPAIKSIFDFTTNNTYIGSPYQINMHNHLRTSLADVSTAKYQSEINWNSTSKQFEINIVYKAESAFNYEQLSSDILKGSAVGAGSYVLSRKLRNK